MVGDIFIAVVAIASVIITFMCGYYSGCKINACFRKGGKNDKT